MVPISIYNTSSEADPIHLAPFVFGAVTDQFPATGPAVIYIVGHGVPNGLATSDGFVIPEANVASGLINSRSSQDKPDTLVIFDTCFSESFRLIDRKAWPENFGLIFSCREYERSWHTGGEGPARVSLFSIALAKALKACVDNGSFAGLQQSLRDDLNPIQTPVVDASDALLRRVFGLPAVPQSLRSAHK
jgi:hypothetical protein